MPRSVPHFKVHTSIQNHAKVMGLYDDDALLAMFVRLGLMAVERFADRTDDSFLCSGMDLERLAGCRGVANARRKLGRLEAAGGPRVLPEGGHFRVSFHNFAKKQGFRGENGAGTGTPATATATATTTAPKRERGADAPAPKALSVPAPKAKIQKPEVFQGEARERIQKWAASKGFAPAVLNQGMERFREWAPLKNATRTQDQWASAFMRIVREGVERGEFSNDPQRKPKGAAYADADEMLRRRREEYEREVASESPEEIGRIIDMALKRDAS